MSRPEGQSIDRVLTIDGRVVPVMKREAAPAPTDSFGVTSPPARGA